MMWTVESEYPNAYKFSTSDELKQDSVWCDQPDTEGYLAEAWTTRRTDDWSFFEQKKRSVSSNVYSSKIETIAPTFSSSA